MSDIKLDPWKRPVSVSFPAPKVKKEWQSGVYQQFGDIQGKPSDNAIAGYYYGLPYHNPFGPVGANGTINPGITDVVIQRGSWVEFGLYYAFTYLIITTDAHGKQTITTDIETAEIPVGQLGTERFNLQLNDDNTIKSFTTFFTPLQGF